VLRLSLSMDHNVRVRFYFWGRPAHVPNRLLLVSTITVRLTVTLIKSEGGGDKVSVVK
jgi:hypothetical protein